MPRVMPQEGGGFGASQQDLGSRLSTHSVVQSENQASSRPSVPDLMQQEGGRSWRGQLLERLERLSMAAWVAVASVRTWQQGWRRHQQRL